MKIMLLYVVERGAVKSCYMYCLYFPVRFGFYVNIQALFYNYCQLLISNIHLEFIIKGFNSAGFKIFFKQFY